MNLESHYGQSRVMFFAISTVLLVLFGWYTVVAQSQNLEAATISTYQTAQLEIVRNAARAANVYITGELERRGTGAIHDIEQDVLRQFVQPIRIGQMGDAWIYSPDYVIFDESEDFPDAYLGKRMDEIFNLQRAKGATHYEDMTRSVLRGREGIGWYVWEPAKARESAPLWEVFTRDAGKEIAAWTPVTVFPGTSEEKTWVIGLSSMLPELMQGNGAYEQIRDSIVTMFIVTIAAGVLLFLLIDGEKARWKHEEAYRSLVMHSLQGLVMLQDWRVVFANPVVQDITGYSEEEMCALSPSELQSHIYPEDRRRVLHHLRACLAGKPSSPVCECRIVHKSGSLRWLEMAFVPTIYRKQQVIQGSIIDTTSRKWVEQALQEAHDELEQRVHERTAELADINAMLQEEIGERERVEAALRQSQELLQGIIEHASALVYVKDTNWCTLLANRQCADFLHIEREKMVGHAEDDILPPEIVSVWRDHDQKVFSLRKPLTFEETFPQSDGLRRTFLSTRFPLYNSEGTLYAIGSIATDITERKQAEIALSQSEERFAKVFHANPLPILITRLFDGVVLDANESFLRLAGYRLDEITGRSSSDIGFATSRDQRKHIVQTLRHQSSIHSVNMPFYTRSGEERLIVAWMELLEIDHSLYVLTILYDVTEQRRAENALAISEEKYRELIENISDVIYVIDDTGTMTYVSPVITQLAGYDPSEVVGQPFLQFIYADDVPVIKEAFAARVAGILGTSEHRIVTKSGELRWVNSASRPVFHDGVLGGIQGIMSDITERKKAEEAIKKRLDIERTLSEVSAFFMHTRDFDNAVTNALEAVGHLSRVSRAYLFLFRDVAGHTMDNTHEWCAPGVPSLKAYRQGVLVNDYMWEAERLRAGNLVQIDNVEELPADALATRTRLTHHGIRSQVLFPVQANQELLGFIGLDHVVSPTHWPQEDVRALQIIAQNIGGAHLRTRAEHALEAQRTFLRQVLDSVPNLIFAKDHNGHFTLANRITADLYGTVVEDMIGKTDRDFRATAHDWQNHRNQDQDILQTLREKITLEETFTTSKGDVWWFHTIKRPIMSADGSLTEVLVVATDITERKRAEIALQASEERYRRLVETSPDAIALFSLDGTFQVVNQSAAKTLGFDHSDDLLGRNVLAFIAAEDRQRATESLHTLQETGRLKNAQFTFLRPGDGTYIPAEVSISVIADSAGKPVACIGVARDVTARVRREREREALFTVATALRTAASRVEMVPILLEQVSLLLNAEGSALLLREVEHGDLVVQLGRGMCESLTGSHLSATEGLNGQVIESGHPHLTYSNDDQTLPLCQEHDNDHRVIHAVACVPLIAQEQTIGTLLAVSQGTISEEEMQLLNAIGNMAANAIHRVTLHEQTERRLKHVQALRTVDQAITSSFDVNLPLTILIEQALEHLKGDAASVLLFNQITNELEYAAGRGFRSTMVRHMRVRLGDGCAGLVALERRFVHEPDMTQADPNCVRAYLMQEEHLTAYYGVPLIARGQIKGVLELFCKRSFRPDQEWIDFFHALAGQAAIAVDNAELFSHLQSTNNELTLAYDATIEGWARALELRDVETEGHSRRVTDLTLKVAATMDFSNEELVHIRRGALLHDIGKMAIPDSVLLKAGPLTEQEQNVMRQHTLYAYRLLSPISFLRPALSIPYCHHEKWDGTGYPRGLQGDTIPLAARIFAVVDVWDALSSDRPYRNAWPPERVLAYIREQSGTHFDPDVVERFLRLMETMTMTMTIQDEESSPG